MLWKYTIANGAVATLTPLTYSAGEQYSLSVRGSDGRRQPTQPASGYVKQASFLAWAAGNGYRNPMLEDGAPWDGVESREPLWPAGLQPRRQRDARDPAWLLLVGDALLRPGWQHLAVRRRARRGRRRPDQLRRDPRPPAARVLGGLLHRRDRRTAWSTPAPTSPMRTPTATACSTAPTTRTTTTCRTSWSSAATRPRASGTPELLPPGRQPADASGAAALRHLRSRQPLQPLPAVRPAPARAPCTRAWAAARARRSTARSTGPALN